MKFLLNVESIAMSNRKSHFFCVIILIIHLNYKYNYIILNRCEDDPSKSDLTIIFYSFKI